MTTIAEHWRLLSDIASVKVCTLITGARCIYTLTFSALVMQRLQVKMIRGQNANEMSIEGERERAHFRGPGHVNIPSEALTRVS